MYNQIMKEKGYVYIFTNKCMPTCIKIGQTKNINKRLKDLDGTNLPMQYEPYFSVYTSHYKKLEKSVHNILSIITGTRIRKNREFYEIEPEKALTLLKGMSLFIKDAVIENYGNDTIEENNPDGSKRIISKNTSFEMLGIPVGSLLEPVSSDYPPVTTTDDKNHVRLSNGEEKAISRVAVEAKGYPINGFSCYKYNGELLQDIRAKKDKNYFLNK